MVGDRARSTRRRRKATLEIEFPSIVFHTASKLGQTSGGVAASARQQQRSRLGKSRARVSPPCSRRYPREQEAGDGVASPSPCGRWRHSCGKENNWGTQRIVGEEDQQATRLGFLLPVDSPVAGEQRRSQAARRMGEKHNASRERSTARYGREAKHVAGKSTGTGAAIPSLIRSYSVCYLFFMRQPKTPKETKQIQNLIRVELDRITVAS